MDGGAGAIRVVSGRMTSERIRQNPYAPALISGGLGSVSPGSWVTMCG